MTEKQNNVKIILFQHLAEKFPRFCSKKRVGEVEIIKYLMSSGFKQGGAIRALIDYENHINDGQRVIESEYQGKKRIMHFKNGKPHREDGPAIILLEKDGSIVSQYFYINGEELIEEDFLNKTEDTSQAHTRMK